MSAHLHIDRLVIAGLPAHRATDALRQDIAAALAARLTPEALRRIAQAQNHSRNQTRSASVAPIVFDPSKPPRALAAEIARAVHAALLPEEPPA